MIREWYVGEALHSVRRLVEILPDLTMEEIQAALSLEHGSRRRHSIVTRLTKRISFIKAAEVQSQLKEYL